MLFHSLFPIALTLFSASNVNAKAGCTTRYHFGSGTTTKTVAATTSTITVNVLPVATTTTTVTADVQTSVTDVLTTSTSTVIGNTNTDTFTATSTIFGFVVPKTTLTAPTFTYTSTSVSTSYLPTSTVTTTSYTVDAAQPTSPAVAVPRRRSRIQGKPHRSNKKVVKCTPVVNAYTTTQSGSATSTITFTSTVFPTVTSTKTLTALVTSTYLPADVTNILTVTSSSTITADTLIFTTTPTQIASTSVPILLTPTATVVKALVSICDPAVVQKQAVSRVQLGQDSNQLVYTLPSQTDEESCCSSAALISGAYGYAYYPFSAQSSGQTGGSCSAGYQDPSSYTSTMCGTQGTVYANFDTFTSDNVYSAGLLQCGSGFSITQGDYSPYNF